MCVPTDVDPTKEMPFTSGCVSSISASLREQVTRFSTPRGSPASAQSSMMRMEVRGTKLAALMTMVLPVAMQSGAIQLIGIMAGKFHGAMPANTPTGSRNYVVS
jgi:hypothetical protein